MVKKQNKAWVVAVNMGYGHQRAAHPLTRIANEGIIIANNYQGIPKKDRRKWEGSRKFYELISRSKQIPLIGKFLFNLYDSKFQKIEPFYPRRDLSADTFQLRQMYRLIRKKDWGRDLIDYLNKNSKLPLVSTFFVPAFFAEEHGYQGDIYCVICDADISRTWAPLEPKKTRIKYLAPCPRVVERLKLYGVPAKNIYLTGFPLPKDNIGGQNLLILKKDLWQRIHHLDPQHRFVAKYRQSLIRYLGKETGHCRRACRVTLTFAVGGAGAQRELGIAIIKSLKQKIINQEIKINLIAGIRNDVYRYFKSSIKKLGLTKYLGKNLEIIFAINKQDYFNKFNQVLRETDILWTKPSELTFFNGLGIPIVMAPPIGSQEVFNQRWLEAVGGGIDQLNPKHTQQWLPDWLNSGWLAEAALQGFLDAPKFGTYKIEQIIFKQKVKKEGRVELL